MDAVDFLKKFDEYCEAHPGCCGCGLRSFNNGQNLKCFEFLKKFPEESVKILEEKK